MPFENEPAPERAAGEVGRHVGGKLQGSGGIPLYWQAWLPSETPRAVVVLGHGGLEHGGRYAHVADRFGEANWATYAVDFRGHGRTGGRAGQVGRMALLVADLDQLVLSGTGIDVSGIPKPLAILARALSAVAPRPTRRSTFMTASTTRSSTSPRKTR